jgi:hypothetical protein
MEPAVRSARIKSAITTGPGSKRPAFGLQDSQNSRQPTGIGRQNPAAGNGIFGCRDWRLKIGLRDRKGHRRPKEWNDTGENPHRNGLSGVSAGISGFVGLDGGVRSRIRTRLSGDSTLETAAIRCFPLSLVKTGNSNPKDFGFRACYP